jgi:hypothetical protein
MTIDDKSPPGSWQREMDMMPWKYSQQAKVSEALSSIRQAGLALEASVLALEITTLKNELEALRGNRK